MLAAKYNSVQYIELKVIPKEKGLWPTAINGPPCPNCANNQMLAENLRPPKVPGSWPRIMSAYTQAEEMRREFGNFQQ